MPRTLTFANIFEKRCENEHMESSETVLYVVLPSSPRTRIPTRSCARVSVHGNGTLRALLEDISREKGSANVSSEEGAKGLATRHRRRLFLHQEERGCHAARTSLAHSTPRMLCVNTRYPTGQSRAKRLPRSASLIDVAGSLRKTLETTPTKGPRLWLSYHRRPCIFLQIAHIQDTVSINFNKVSQALRDSFSASLTKCCCNALDWTVLLGRSSIIFLHRSRTTSCSASLHLKPTSAALWTQI